MKKILFLSLVLIGVSPISKADDFLEGTGGPVAESDRAIDDAQDEGQGENSPVVANAPAGDKVVAADPNNNSPAAAPVKEADKANVLEKIPNKWIEGEGYKTTLNGTVEDCNKLCAADANCKIMEFYHPENKCNLYNDAKLTLNDGDEKAEVAVRK